MKASDGWGGALIKTVTIKVLNVTELTPLVLHGTAAAEQVVGESGGDKIYGLGGNDTLFGQLGNDTLYGGAGKDTLLGGAGKDAFVIDTKPTARTIDWIYDFKAGEDKIYLPKAIFSHLARRGTLSKDAFVVSDHFADQNDRILYLKKQGALFYDPDGSGAAHAIQIATITANLHLKFSDFIVI